MFVSDEMDLKDLFDKSAIIDISRVGAVETKSLIMGLVVMKLQDSNRDISEGPQWDEADLPEFETPKLEDGPIEDVESQENAEEGNEGEDSSDENEPDMDEPDEGDSPEYDEDGTRELTEDEKQELKDVIEAEGEEYEVRVFLSLDPGDNNYCITKPLDFFLNKTKAKIVPIGIDSGDNYYCVNNETGKVYYWGASEDSYYCIAETIEKFVSLFE